MQMGVQVDGVSTPSNVSERAIIEISEAVRELGVRFKGVDNRRLMFERVKTESPTQENVEIIAARIGHVVKTLARDSSLVRDFLEQVRPERLLIS
ncbi:MAG: hypothetical protein NVSMB64_15680 [Candidatus Velthaea sp.]